MRPQDELRLLAALGIGLASCTTEPAPARAIDAAAPSLDAGHEPDVAPLPQDAGPAATDAAPNDATRDGGADASRDGAPDPFDAGLHLDAGAPTDAGVVPLGPTWAECRRAHLAGSVDPQLAADCVRLHRSAPGPRADGTTQIYGIRWVVMTPLPSPTYIADNLRVMNQMYNPAGIVWRTEETHDISAATLTVDTGDNQDGGPWALETLRGDIAAHLGLPPNTTAQQALQELQRRLRGEGVSATEVNRLTATAEVRPKGFLQTIARTRPELFHVFIVAGGGNAGTRDFLAVDSARTNVGILRAEPFDQTPIVLAHEVGHFFGLKHTHGDGDPRNRDEVEYDAARLVGRWGTTGAFDVLAAQGFGNRLNQPLSAVSTYLPHDATEAEAATFSTFIDALVDVYVLPDLLYERRSSGAMVTVGRGANRLGDFRTRIDRAGTMYWKVFGKKFPDQSRLTNCNHDPNDLTLPLVCTYGMEMRSGDDALLDDLVTTHGGTRSDLMSYVVPMNANGDPIWTASDPEKAFTPTQIELLSVYANAPWMGLLRNYALGR